MRGEVPEQVGVERAELPPAQPHKRETLRGASAREPLEDGMVEVLEADEQHQAELACAPAGRALRPRRSRWASGFSTKTCLPASSARPAISACVSIGDAPITPAIDSAASTRSSELVGSTSGWRLGEPGSCWPGLHACSRARRLEPRRKCGEQPPCEAAGADERDAGGALSQPGSRARRSSCWPASRRGRRSDAAADGSQIQDGLAADVIPPILHIPRSYCRRSACRVPSPTLPRTPRVAPASRGGVVATARTRWRRRGRAWRALGSRRPEPSRRCARCRSS